MVDWNSPEEIETDYRMSSIGPTVPDPVSFICYAVAFIKFMHALYGLYL